MALVVKRKASDSDDKLIAEFRRLVLKHKVIDQIKDSLVYLKPSAKRNIAKNARKRGKKIR